MTNNNFLNSSTKNQLLSLLQQQGVPNVNDEIYTECANFLFYTSWFEEILFTNEFRQNPDNDRKICNDVSSKIDLQKFDFFGEHFYTRYFNQNEKTTKQFRHLKLGNKYKNRVESALRDFKKNQTRTSDLLYAYLMITYRFRNNMFHGAKGIINLSNYIEQFRIINHFMYLLLAEIYRINYKGYHDL